MAFSLAHIELVGWYVDLPWKKALWAAMAAGVVALLVYVRVVVPVLLRRRPWVVEAVTPERGRAWTVWLRPQGHGGLRFAPGQFAWLTLGRDPFVIEDHPFSFSSSAQDHERIAFTIKDLGDFTHTVGEVEPGTRAYVEGPHGAFSIDRYDGEGYVFVAGGVGITPVMSMLRTLADREDMRPHLLLYGAGAWDELTFREELEELRRAPAPAYRLRTVGTEVRAWEGETGRIDAEVLDRHLPSDRAAHRYFVCGPPRDDGRGRAGAPPQRRPLAEHLHGTLRHGLSVPPGGGGTSCVTCTRHGSSSSIAALVVGASLLFAVLRS